MTTPVDVVVVSYNNAENLRRCVEPLTGFESVNVIVVDNASTDGSLQTVSDLPLAAIAGAANDGFAAGCNAGCRSGYAPYVAFLNPDASIDEGSLRVLVKLLADDPRLGAVAPLIRHADGSIAWSQRRFPRLRSTYARAFFLHRLFPRATWVDEVIRNPNAYLQSSTPDWLSGACLVVRRSAFEEVGGWDETFFLYAEDIDLCKRLRECGWDLRFEPTAHVKHDGGTSATRRATLPLLALSRLAYARKHFSPGAVLLERVGIALEALTRVVLSRGGVAERIGHARALALALFGIPPPVPRDGTAAGSRGA